MKLNKDSNLYLIVIILSVCCFINIYGVQILDPRYIDWLLDGNGQDLSQHYIGWEAYRLGAWQFPIGLTDRLNYPDSTSVIFTDSIPLFAVIFKIISPILPDKFQYFGFWGIFCFILQGILVTKIIKNYSTNVIVVLSSVVIFLNFPVMLLRMYAHTSLAGQWIILLALLPFFDKNILKENKLIGLFSIVGILASSIHMYFVLMCGCILLGFLFYFYRVTINIKAVIKIVCAYILSVLMTVFILGGFSSKSSTYAIDGLGYYSFNLDGFLNPFGWSRLLPNLPTYTEGQYEGMAYLGIGGIILWLVSIFLLAFHKEKAIGSVKNTKSFFGLLVVFFLILFVAMSPEASFLYYKIYSINLPKIIYKTWSIFRTSGRIIMVNSYIIILLSIIILTKTLSNKKVTALILVCTCLQVYDLQPILKEKYTYFSNHITYESVLKGDIWTEIANNKKIKHLVVTHWDNNELYQLGQFAMTNNKTMNAFAMAHADQEQLIKSSKKELANIDNSKIYIFKDDGNKIKFLNFNLHYYTDGNFIIGYKEPIKGYHEQSLEQFMQSVLVYKDNLNLSNGIDDKQGRIIYPTGFSFGPYWLIPKGEYIVHIIGKNLDVLDVAATDDFGKKQIKVKFINKASDSIYLKISLAEVAETFELILKNNSNKNVVVTKVEIICNRKESL